MTEALISFVELQTKFHEENSSIWHEGYQSYEDMKWMLLMFAVDDLCDLALKENLSFYLKEADMSCVKSGFTEHFSERPNGGLWEILGYEACHFDEHQPDFVGMNGCISQKDDYERPDFPRFWQYKFYYHHIQKATPEHLTMEEGYALQMLARGTAKPEDYLCKRLESFGYLKKQGDTYVPTFYVQDKAKIKPFTAEQKAELDRIGKKVSQMLSDMYREISGVIIEDAPKQLTDTPRAINFAISCMLTDVRGVVLEEALRQGYLVYHDAENEATERMLGAYLSM